MQVLIPLAGKGKRFLDAGYTIPKSLIEVEGKTIIEHIISQFSQEDNFVFGCNEEHLNETNLKEILENSTRKNIIVPMKYKKEGPIYGLKNMKDYILDDEECVVNYTDFSWVWDYSDFKNQIKKNNCDGAVVCYRGFHPHLLSDNKYATINADGIWMKEIKEKFSWNKNKMDDWSSSGTYYFKKGSYVKKYIEEINKFEDWKINGEFYVSQLFQLMKMDGLNILIYEIPFMLQWGTPEDLEEYLFWSEYFLKPKNTSKKIYDMNVVIPMAGDGKRFSDEGYDSPKPLILVDNVPMVKRACDDLPQGTEIFLILRKEHDEKFNLLSNFKKHEFNFNPILIDTKTEGQASTVLLCKNFIDKNKPILIGACDNGLIIDSEKFEKCFNDKNIDALIFSFRNNCASIRNPEMYSWIEVDELNKVKRVSMKRPISSNPKNDHCVVGGFWFRNAKTLFENIEEMIKSNERTNNEFYLDNVINYFVKNNLNVYAFEVDKYICWGTPNDLRVYEYWKKYFNLKYDLGRNIYAKK